METNVLTIPIENFLEKLGHRPTRRHGNKLWYSSPLHNERTPSFKVQTDSNLWYDFGIGKGGNIIELGKVMYGSDDVRSVIDRIAQGCPGFKPFMPRSAAPRTSPFSDLYVCEVTDRRLMDYMVIERGIPPSIVQQYCREAHYVLEGKSRRAIAFANDSGGYELRNPWFKGSTSPKDVTLLVNSSRECWVYEGFIDMLSGVTMGWSHMADMLVLNSVNTIDKALPKLATYERVHCCLDNDDAGRRATKTIRTTPGIRAVDYAPFYSHHNDFNDFLLSFRKF